jgi:predicted nucleotidyltransferase
MNAAPLLQEIARAMQECGLEAVLVGNAAAALQGAPVTTLDFDFMFRETPANLNKLRRLANKLDGSILKPYYPASKLYRLVNEDRGIQLDFMPVLHGIRTYEGLRSRAERVTFGDSHLYVAALEDVIRSKRALGRPRDRAVLEILEKTRDEKAKADQAEDPG